jgi:hypothetical protein
MWGKLAEPWRSLASLDPSPAAVDGGVRSYEIPLSIYGEARPRHGERYPHTQRDTTIVGGRT